MGYATSVDVRMRVNEPHALLMVDATLNEKKFEHAMSDRIFQALQARRVPIAGGAVHKPGTLDGFHRVFQESSRQRWSTLLLVAHGGPYDDDAGAKLKLCGTVYPWAFAGHLGLNIEDKLACLGICHGSNPDSDVALIDTENVALMTVGPNTTLSSDECEAFFCAFLGELFSAVAGDWEEERIQAVLDKHNHLATEKMHLQAIVPRVD